jgi:hypothetical protein
MRKAGYTILSLLAASLALTNSSQAFVDPVTVGMTISLINQGLSLGAKSDPQAQEVSAILEHVRAMEKRLTQIEDGIIDIQQMIAQLPQRWRDDLKSLVDTLRKEDMRAISEVLEEFAAGLSAAENNAPDQTERFQRRLEQAIVLFKVNRAALVQRSGAVASYMIGAMVQEMAIERRLGIPRESITDILSFYDRYFADMQDRSLVDSLAQVRVKFESDHIADRKSLARLLAKNESSPLEGEYPFYDVTQMTLVQKEVQKFGPVSCGEMRSCQGHYTDTVTEPVPVKTLRYKWKLRFTPYEDQPDLGTLEVQDYLWREDAGPPAADSSTDLTAIQAKYDVVRSQVREKVKEMNIRDQAIGLIREQEMAVATARTLIANWESGEAEALAAWVNTLLSGDVSALNGQIEDIQRLMPVETNRENMVETRRRALEPVREAEERLREAIEQARADQWRRDLMHGLALTEFAIKTYQVVATYLPKDESKAAPAKEEPKAPPKGQAEPLPAKGARQQLLPDPRIGSSADHRGTVRKLTDSARVHLNNTKAMPAEHWPRLPDDDTFSEAELNEGLADLDLADQAAVVLKRLKPGAEYPTEAELGKEGAKLALDGNYWKALIGALAPTPTAAPDDDMVGGFADRNSLRAESVNRLADFAAKRAEQARISRKQGQQ